MSYLDKTLSSYYVYYCKEIQFSYKFVIFTFRVSSAEAGKSTVTMDHCKHYNKAKANVVHINTTSGVLSAAFSQKPHPIVHINIIDSFSQRHFHAHSTFLTHPFDNYSKRELLQFSTYTYRQHMSYPKLE